MPPATVTHATINIPIREKPDYEKHEGYFPPAITYLKLCATTKQHRKSVGARLAINNKRMKSTPLHTRGNFLIQQYPYRH